MALNNHETDVKVKQPTGTIILRNLLLKVHETTSCNVIYIKDVLLEEVAVIMSYYTLVGVSVSTSDMKQPFSVRQRHVDQLGEIIVTLLLYSETALRSISTGNAVRFSISLVQKDVTRHQHWHLSDQPSSCQAELTEKNNQTKHT